MPTYEYACTSCAHEWEFEQSIKEAPLTECPSCGNASARRQISRGTGFILKGGGWYSDLYSSSSNKPPAKSDSGSNSDGGSSNGSGGSADSGGKSDSGSSAKSDSGASASAAA